jgi:hypothetical protein
MSNQSIVDRFRDPLVFARRFWGDSLVFYKKQVDLLYSVRDNDETVCVAGNMLGSCPPLVA